jgi:hypothetical protein
MFLIDVDQVRKEYRIIGTLVGCLPRLPKQNVHLGLPLQLSILEARLLVEIGKFESKLTYLLAVTEANKAGVIQCHKNFY